MSNRAKKRVFGAAAGLVRVSLALQKGLGWHRTTTSGETRVKPARSHEPEAGFQDISHPLNVMAQHRCSLVLREEWARLGFSPFGKVKENEQPLKWGLWFSFFSSSFFFRSHMTPSENRLPAVQLWGGRGVLDSFCLLVCFT